MLHTTPILIQIHIMTRDSLFTELGSFVRAKRGTPAAPVASFVGRALRSGPPPQTRARRVRLAPRVRQTRTQPCALALEGHQPPSIAWLRLDRRATESPTLRPSQPGPAGARTIRAPADAGRILARCLG